MSFAHGHDGGGKWWEWDLRYHIATCKVSTNLAYGGWGKSAGHHWKKLNHVTVRITPNGLFNNPAAAAPYNRGTRPF